jgi:hypothetical protein
MNLDRFDIAYLRHRVGAVLPAARMHLSAKVPRSAKARAVYSPAIRKRMKKLIRQSNEAA